MYLSIAVPLRFSNLVPDPRRRAWTGTGTHGRCFCEGGSWRCWGMSWWRGRRTGGAAGGAAGELCAGGGADDVAGLAAFGASAVPVRRLISEEVRTGLPIRRAAPRVGAARIH